MAKVRFFKNFINESYEEKEVKSGTTIKECVDSYSVVNPYSADFVECYDPETEKTWFAPFEEDDEGSVLATVNEQIVSPDYKIQKNDVVFIIFLPTSGPSGNAWLTGFVMAVGGAIFGGVCGGLPGAIIGLVGGFVGGVLGTWGTEEAIKKSVKPQKKGGSSDYGKEASRLPDVRGAENQPLVNNVYPAVIGKHAISPFLVGNPITTYEGNLGRDAYISLLYCVGYAPLKLTDFKLGDYMLAYNRSHGSVNRNTILSGMLRGYSSGGTADNGDILDLWANNDISLEIIQQAPGQINRGAIYPTTKVDKAIDANCLYIVDKPLSDLAQVVYKGASFPTNFKTNNVYFTESFPNSFTITLTASEGLYASRSHTDGDGNSEVIYESIPLWYCIQWRPYSNRNASSQSDGSDFYGWNNIFFDNTAVTFTDYQRRVDIEKHLGNTIEEVINSNFIDKPLCNFGVYSGEEFVTEMRFSQTVTIPDSVIDKIVYDKSNTVHGVEVRILRVSPSYQNQRSSKGEYGPYSYSDVIGVKSICTELLDVEHYKKTGQRRAVSAIPYDEDLKKFCYIAIRAKADLNGTVSQSLTKLSCTAEAFTPYWNKSEQKWYPENVRKIESYYGFYDNKTKGNKINKKSDAYKVQVTREEYLQARKNHLNWIKTKGGSNFTDKIKGAIFTRRDDWGRYVLTTEGTKYLNQDSASNFMLGIIGAHCGIVARGYEDLNLSSIGEWHDDIMNLTDGSTDESGNLVSITMESNGYLFKGVKLEQLLAKIAATGRAVYTYDETGKIKVIMDKPALYPVGVINDQNCLSAQDSYDYNEIPAGLVISFPDENDGYETNNLYCWSDGNSFDNYKGQVKPYSIEFVTKPEQAWSLGRYALANIVLGKRRLVRKIGMEGMIYSLGDLLMVQSDNLLVGDGSGRVQQVIEVENNIYGFVCDSTYNFTGEFNEEGRSVQGVSIFQPKNMSRDKIITLPLAKPGFSITVSTSIGGEVTYKQIVGTTNVILFDKPYPKYRVNSNGEKYKTQYNMSTGDICFFGDFERTAAPYRIVKVKREGDNTFTETLLRYDESIYNYGAKLPSFQSYAKTPPVPKDPISLSEVPSNILDLNNNKQGNNNFIETQMSKLYSNREIHLYKRTTQVDPEIGITAKLTYNFSDNTMAWDDPIGTNGWKMTYQEADAAGKGSMYFISATAFGRGLTDVINENEWSLPIVFGANGKEGPAGITITAEKLAIVYNATSEGFVAEKTIRDKIILEQEGVAIPFVIGEIESPPGFEVTSEGDTVIIKALSGTSMAPDGMIGIPINYATVNIIRYEDEEKNIYTDSYGDSYADIQYIGEGLTHTLFISYAKANKGDKGEGLSDITEFFLVDANKTGITVDDERWNETAPEMTPELKYLWNYEKIIYSDGRVQKNPPRVIGTYGESGAEGNGVSQITNYYLKSERSEGITIEGNVWVETPPTVTEDVPFLWNYEKVEYTKAAPYITDPRVIGSYGKKGDPGKDGTNGKRAPKYWGKRTNDPTDNIIIGDYYLNVDDVRIHRCSQITIDNVSTWEILLPDTLESQALYFLQINEVMSLISTLPADDPVKLFVNNYVELLLVDTEFVNYLGAKKIRVLNNGCIIGGNRYNDDGDFINPQERGFYISADGNIKGIFTGDLANTLIGDRAGEKLLFNSYENKGNFNVLVGEEAGRSLSSANDNVVIGYRNSTLGFNLQNCVSIGTQAQIKDEDLTLTKGNIAIGSFCEIIGGDENVVVGYVGSVRKRKAIAKINSNSVFGTNAVVLDNSNCVAIGNNTQIYSRLPNRLDGSIAIGDGIEITGDVPQINIGNVFKYDGTAADVPALIAPATIIANASATAPKGWLQCNGQAVSRATYSRLFQAIGTRYGSGNGSTTFNIPDLRNRFIMGAGGVAGWGSYLREQLPNVKGTFDSRCCDFSGAPYGIPIIWGDGSLIKNLGNYGRIADGLHKYNCSQHTNLHEINLANANNIYTDGGSVRPLSIAMYYYIKY